MTIKQKLAILGVSTAIAGGALIVGNQPTIVPPAPISFNGQQITFPYTDENVGEDLLIYTDQQTYSSWDTAFIYFAVQNTSVTDQNVQIQFHSGKDEQITTIEEFKSQVPYEIDVIDYEEKETCEVIFDVLDKIDKEQCYKKQIGTHKETKYRDEWGTISKKAIEDFKSKDSKKNELLSAKVQAEYWIPSGQTKYFKAELKFTPGKLGQPSGGEFYIKAFGSSNGFGSLDPWYSSSWGYRRAIEIVPSKVGTTTPVTGFPVLVSTTLADWKYTSNGGKMGKTDGTDMLFTLSDGTTKLDHEIEKYSSSTGEMIAWIDFSGTLSTTSTTTIYSYYGNSGASDQQNTTGTWDSNYTGVWHMPNGTTLTSNDSTSGGHNASQVNTPTASAGKIDGSATFASASSQYMNVADYADLDAQTFTVSGWFKTSTTGAYQEIARRDISSGARTFLFRITDTNVVQGLLIYGGNPGVSSASTYTDGNWHYAVMTATFSSPNTALELFVDGVSQGTNTATAGAPASTEGLDIARYNDGITPEYMNGSLDEVRHSKTNRSSAWVWTEYNNQSATSTFYWIGSEENAPSASTAKPPLLMFD